LASEDGDSAVAVARRVGVHPRTVERWRERFRRQGLRGLHDKPRPGAPPKFTPVTRLELIALACEPVARHEGKTTRTIAELVDEAVARRLVDGIGWSSYQRLLADSDLRLHRVQGWLHSPDPQFREKVTEITELYLHPPAGAVVLSIDEKTGMQALERRFPDRPAGPGRRRRREFEYTRHGTQSLLCAFEVHPGRVVADCGATRTARGAGAAAVQEEQRLAPLTGAADQPQRIHALPRSGPWGLDEHRTACEEGSVVLRVPRVIVPEGLRWSHSGPSLLSTVGETDLSQLGRAAATNSSSPDPKFRAFPMRISSSSPPTRPAARQRWPVAVACVISSTDHVDMLTACRKISLK
jgi:hypothetical protein